MGLSPNIQTGIAKECFAGVGDWTDLSGMLMPVSEEQRLVGDIKNGSLDQISLRCWDRLTKSTEITLIQMVVDISDDSHLLRAPCDWGWWEHVIRQDYIKARPCMDCRNSQGCRKGIRPGRCGTWVLENFISQLDRKWTSETKDWTCKINNWEWRIGMRIGNGELWYAFLFKTIYLEEG